MAGVVDRLLAQLPGLQGQPEPTRAPSVARTTFSAAPTYSAAIDGSNPQRQALSMWFRVVLGLSLGITMGWWPYPRACGIQLFSYLAAVATVVVAGMWAASASWRVRSGLAHALALVLVFYGLLLATSELLPRTGYAIESATWSCPDAGPGPAIVLSSDS
jgi:hypothetical protein